MLDKGASGLDKTIEFWKNMDVLMVGGYENEEDYNTLRILESNGIKIAFLSYTYGTNGMRLPTSSEYIVPYINDADIVRQTALAKEVGPSNIQVNAIAPVVIETDMLRDFSETDKQALADDTPLCRIGTPKDVAKAALFLASDDADFITGQVLGVNGGFVI